MDHLSCLHGANIRGISCAAETAIQTCKRAWRALEKKGGKFELLDATDSSALTLVHGRFMAEKVW